jgi:hypothetical protein
MNVISVPPVDVFSLISYPTAIYFSLLQPQSAVANLNSVLLHKSRVPDLTNHVFRKKWALKSQFILLEP